MSSGFVGTIIDTTIKNGGVTVDCVKQQVLSPDDSWYFPRWPEHTQIVAREVLGVTIYNFIQTHNEELSEPDIFLGTWFNPKNQRYYIDLNTRASDLSTAKTLAELYSLEGKRQIVSIYNSLTQETVYL